MSTRTLLPCIALALLMATGCVAEVADATEIVDELGASSAGLTATENVPLYLRHLTLFRTGEGIGKPEIYVICKSRTRWTSQRYLEYVDDENNTYRPNILLMTVQPHEWPVVCEVMDGDNNATADDMIGYAVFTYADVAGSNAKICGSGGEGDVHVGVSRVKGPNTCPGAESLGIVCPQKCTNLRWH